ncbi:hypothetical protein BDF19DRAFT_429418 [Syncephalis fuscata]|nr:hypothetical protein BDF19DRAFT_429418 [Syncephalis fuscata]
MDVVVEDTVAATNKICFPTIDIYDCVVDQRLNYAIMACLVMSCLNSGVAGMVAIYRWSHGLLTTLFRRVDGYWMPKPVDMLLIGLWLMNGVRAIMYTCTLFDWPTCRLARTMINVTGTILMPLVTTLFVVGIIAHIPTMFAQSTFKTNRKTINNNSDDSGKTDMDYRHDSYIISSATAVKEVVAQWKKYTIRLPSTTLLHWVTVGICLQMILLYLAMAIWLGWAHEQKHTRMIRIANPLLLVSMVLSTGVILAASIYYCYGFYKIMYVHVHRPTSKSQTTNTAEKRSAYRFRNIFLAIIIIYATACIHMVIKGVGGEYISRRPWIHMMVILTPYAMYHHHSIVAPMHPKYSYRTTSQGRTTTTTTAPTNSTLHYTNQDPSLIWHSFTSMTPPTIAGTDRDEYITDIDLIAGRVYTSQYEKHSISSNATTQCDSFVISIGSK